MKVIEIYPAALIVSLLSVTPPAFAQDDVTTQHATSAYAGGYITGPASNPLSFLNGPAYRTFGSTAPYDFPDIAPASLLNRQLPKWISFGWEERFRYEGYHNSGFKLNNNDSYLLGPLPSRGDHPALGLVQSVGAGAGRAPVHAEAAMGSAQPERVGSETRLRRIRRSRKTMDQRARGPADRSTTTTPSLRIRNGAARGDPTTRSSPIFTTIATVWVSSRPRRWFRSPTGSAITRRATTSTAPTARSTISFPTPRLSRSSSGAFSRAWRLRPPPASRPAGKTKRLTGSVSKAWR